jgi:hypothetical protein
VEMKEGLKASVNQDTIMTSRFIKTMEKSRAMSVDRVSKVESLDD